MNKEHVKGAGPMGERNGAYRTGRYTPGQSMQPPGDAGFMFVVKLPSLGGHLCAS